MRAAAILSALILVGCASAPAEHASHSAWRGREIAAHNCAGCHDVNRDGLSHFAPAPAFRDLALADPAAIRDFAADLSRHHPRGMPQVLLSRREAEDLYAYIETLRSPDPQARLPDAPSCLLRVC